MLSSYSAHIVMFAARTWNFLDVMVLELKTVVLS